MFRSELETAATQFHVLKLFNIIYFVLNNGINVKLVLICPQNHYSCVGTDQLSRNVVNFLRLCFMLYYMLDNYE